MSAAQVPDLDAAAFSHEVDALLRRPVRVRRPPRRRDATAATLEAVLAAAGELLDEHGVEGLRIADVCERSGIGTSSIYHLFGDRDGLIAATLTDRFDRSIVSSSSIAQLAAHLPDGVDGVVEFGRRYLVSVYTDPAREQSRWARVTALGAACHRPPLAERLGDALRSYVERMEPLLAGAQDLGVIHPDVDLVALALYGQAHQFGLLANRFDRQPVPMAAWEAVVMRTMGMLAPGVAHPVAVVPDSTRATTHQGAGANRDAPSSSVPGGDDALQSVVDVARAAFAEGGADAVLVADVREQAGVSAGWFHRIFGDRDGLIDEVRLTAYDEHLGAETAGLVRVLREAGSPEQFVGHLLVLAAGVLRSATRAELWFRVEVLSALDGRPGLLRDIAEIDARHTASLVDAVVDAQARGVLASDLDARAVARFAQGMHFGFLLSSISGLEPTPLEWSSVFERIVWGLTPAVVHSL